MCYSNDYEQLNRRNNLARSSTTLPAVEGVTAAAGFGLLIYSHFKKSKNEHAMWIPTPSGLVIEGRF